MSVYYEECADLFSQPSCRDAWHAASKTPLADQAKLVTEACRKAYCPMLGSFAFDICKESFVSTPESIAKSWPPLFDAIVAREAGAASNDVSTMLVAVYARSLQLKAQEPAAASAAAPGAAPSGSAAPAGSSSAAPGASGSGSAAPPVPPAPAAPASGSAAPRGAVAPGASAKAAAAPAPAKATAKTH